MQQVRLTADCCLDCCCFANLALSEPTPLLCLPHEDSIPIKFNLVDKAPRMFVGQITAAHKDLACSSRSALQKSMPARELLM